MRRYVMTAKAHSMTGTYSGYRTPLAILAP